MTADLKPDPSMIGGVAKLPLARLPGDPAALFRTRATRLDFLAGYSDNLAPYLRFLADICRAQADLAAELPRPDALPEDRIEAARANRMPPIDRARQKPALHEVLVRFCELATSIDMPEPSRMALDAVRAATDSDRDWLIDNVLNDQIPADSVAPHLFAAAAVQVHLAMLASRLDVDKLIPIRTGTCPACGGRPAASLVTGNMGIEGARFAACSCCQTLWNEVRIKCLCCGSTKGISYLSVETDDATVKAETCSECDHWVKILYQNKNPTLEAIADDVASLGLDLKMQDTNFRRGGFDPFLVGY